jgi:threonine synthase
VPHVTHLAKPVINPRLTGFQCIRCEAAYPAADYAEGCPACQAAGASGSVVPTYSGPLPPAAPDLRGMMRFADRLPYTSFLSLGEGDTPLISLDRLAGELGLDAVLVKNECANPTGSHKDRMSAQFTARAIARDAPVIAAASSGNAGVSIASYAAAAGIPCVIVTTPKISLAWRRAIEITGAELRMVEDPLDRWRLIREKTVTQGWVSATNVMVPPTGSEPFGVDGYKTLGYELGEDGDTADCGDAILVPTARGDLIWGIYKGFQDLIALGSLRRMPRLIAVEPFPRLERVLGGADIRSRFPGASPLSSIGGATVTYQALTAVRVSGGTAVSVRAEQVIADQKILARSGLYLELSAAAALTGLRILLAEKPAAIRRATLIATSHGYKESGA